MRDLIGEVPFWFISDMSDVALYSSARLSRNFRKISFPSSLEYRHSKEIEKITDGILHEDLNSGTVIKRDLSGTGYQDILWMQKMKIIPDLKKEQYIGMAIYYHVVHRAFLVINYMDHLTFFCHMGGAEIKKAYKGCMKFAELFGEADLSRDSQGNYKTSSLGYFGSGLKLFSILTLPALRINGKYSEISGSLGSNKLLSTGYSGLAENDMTVISNRDSFSDKPAVTVGFFKKVLEELQFQSGKNSVPDEENIEVLKEKILKIIGLQHLTFNEFIDIYYMLSYISFNTGSKIRMTDVNKELVFMLSGFPKNTSGLSSKKALSDDFCRKIKKLLTKES